MGRLVRNHSTNIEGLITLLKRICSNVEIKSVTPGVLAKTRGKAPKLLLRISVPIRGGYKLIARKGGLSQEVFVITDCSLTCLEKLIEDALKY